MYFGQKTGKCVKIIVVKEVDMKRYPHHDDDDRKGQSVVEYLLVITAVFVVLVVFLRPWGPFQGALNKTMNYSSNAMERTADDVFNRMGFNVT